MASHKPKLLIVEDDLGLCSQYRWAFPAFEVVFAHDRAQALAIGQKQLPPLAIMDLGLPPDPDGVSEGFATLDGLLGRSPRTKVIIATSHVDRTHALRAVAAGAYDFCDKPIDIQVLGLIAERALALTMLEAENRRLSDAGAAGSIRRIVTADAGMLRVCRDVEKLAAANVPVLLSGESGTGKGALARALHDRGPRAGQAFVTVSCGAVPEQLLEGELFGRGPDAASGTDQNTRPGTSLGEPGKIEAADGGTLFLDDVDALPQSVQMRLLRFFEDGRVERRGGRDPVPADVRVVSATASQLEVLVERGAFRAELFYRLNPVTIRVPPLRERPADVVLIARTFLASLNVEFGRSLKGFADDALLALSEHPWPGNVRELENRVKRAVVMSGNRLVSAADLELASTAADPSIYDLRQARARAEREVVQRALARSNGRMSAAARLLGISRPTLYSLLESHGMSAEVAEPGVDDGGRSGADDMRAESMGQT